MRKKKILFTGITGLLGGYFLKKRLSNYDVFGSGNKNINITSPNIFKLNITDKTSTFDLINKINPDIVVHAAASGNVDYCEKNPRS